jgi:hypothetical protein
MSEMSWFQKLFRCRTCEILEKQIEYERARSLELTTTITSLLKPAPIILQEKPETIVPTSVATSWSRKRAALEQRDRLQASLNKNDKLQAKPDDEIKETKINPSASQKSIEQLEKELGIVDSDSETSEAEAEEVH